MYVSPTLFLLFSYLLLLFYRDQVSGVSFYDCVSYQSSESRPETCSTEVIVRFSDDHLVASRKFRQVVLLDESQMSCDRVCEGRIVKISTPHIR